MKKKILLILISIVSSFSQALTLEKNMWHDFEGKIGNSEIQLSIYISNDGHVNGNYCYKKFEKKIFISGTINNDLFEFTELIEDNPNGYLKGSISTIGNIKLEGTWTNFERTKYLNLNVQHYASCGGTLEHRYMDLFGTDEEVETFMKHVKKSILNNDKEWLSNQVNFPITINTEKKKLTLINKSQFIQNFEIIFSEEFKLKIKSFCICNLFNNNKGSMIGNGEIWINNSSNSKKNKYEFRITAINN
jgi:hypothetical protein